MIMNCYKISMAVRNYSGHSYVYYSCYITIHVNLFIYNVQTKSSISCLGSNMKSIIEMCSKENSHYNLKTAISCLFMQIV